MVNTKYSRAPRRPIETIWSTISHFVMIATTDYVLHTAEDRETLVRAIIDLKHTHLFMADELIMLLLEVAPKAVPIGTSTKVESLDNPRPMQQIWGTLENSAEDKETQKVFVDLASMRKLQKGDQIILRDATVQDNGYRLTGRITLFFKE